MWEVDVRQLWNTFSWTPYESCNKCALACYLEPSLFRWTDLSSLRERVVDGAVNYLKRAPKVSSRRESGRFIHIERPTD